MTDSVVVEGPVKLRDGKKWRSRWLVLRKPSPVADCLVLLVSKERGAKERSSIVLEHICGLEMGLGGEGVSCTLTLLCLNQSIQLGFDSKEALLAWDLRLRYYLGEVHSFNVTVLPGTKLESGPATLHLCNNLLVLARDTPPLIIGQWNLLDLRRYGPVASGFVFEGGTRCGYWAGVFFLSCAEGEQISFLFDCIVRGISPSRVPFGLKPLLPEPCSSTASVEEKLNIETEELEKRLSLLSHSTASSSSFSSSAVGDDRSISGSSDTSDTSQSDSSIGSRLTVWAEPGPSTPSESFLSVATARSDAEEKLSASITGGPRVPSKHGARSRRLQDIGRQGSSDSGIATGSHSSYSGSFSSYLGSVDTGSSGEDYGSLFYLPPLSGSEKHLCTCPAGHAHEYQVPSSLRYLYDTPRSLRELSADPDQMELLITEQTDETPKEQSQASAEFLSIPEFPTHSSSSSSLVCGHGPEGTQKVSQKSKEMSDCPICIPHPSVSRSLFTTCPVCGGLKRAPFPQPEAALQSDVTSAGENPNNFTPDASDCATNPDGKLQTESCESFAPTNLTGENLSLAGSGCAGERDLGRYADSLSDLLGHYCPGESGAVSVKLSMSQPPGCYCPPGCNKRGSVRTSAYESMCSALASPAFPAFCHPSGAVSARHSSCSAIYENCRQCIQGQRGCWLPKAIPTVITGSSSELQSPHGPPTFTSSSMQSHDGVTGEDKKQRIPGEKGRTDPAYEVMEGRSTDKSSEADERVRYELLSTGGQQRSPNAAEEGSAPSSRPRGDGVTYVNIPISPTSKKQLHYMELELQEHGATIRGKPSTKYAQIDITATEMAHRVGTQHALGREEGLQRLEQWRRGGAPQ